MSKKKILMVCLGNICRSPLAEGIMRAKVSSKNIEVDSAGTGNWHVGNPPDRRSIEIGQKHNIDISGLRGRQFSHQDFIDFDQIYVMDQNNLEDVLALAKTSNEKQKVSMILDAVFSGERVDVPDPYHGNLDNFEQVYQMLEAACEILAKRLA